LAWAGIVGPAAFGLAAAIGAPLEDSYLGGDAYRPGLHGGYSQVHSFVSELAADGSGVQLLMTAGFLVLGLCTLLFAWSLRRLWAAAALLAVAVALSGVGVIAAGTFSCDAGCPTDGVRSTSQELHDVASVLTFGSWMAVALIAGWQHRRTAYGKASLGLFGVQVAAAAILSSFGERDADDPVGLYQRIMLTAVAAWFVLTAIELRRSAGADHASRNSSGTSTARGGSAYGPTASTHPAGSQAQS
jgi:hypothetical protein